MKIENGNATREGGEMKARIEQLIEASKNETIMAQAAKARGMMVSWQNHATRSMRLRQRAEELAAA
jgi:hypothetical protein